MTSPRHPDFPHVPADQMVGPMSGRRFMEGYSDHTLREISKGQCCEPPGVIHLAKNILRVRRVGGKIETLRPPSVKTQADQIKFDQWLEQANESPNRALKHSAIVLLQNTFGYNWHKEAQRS